MQILKVGLFLLCCTAVAFPQERQLATPFDRNKLVELTALDVKGSRLPAQSVIRLSGLKIGQQVNYDMLHEASKKITSTGLVKSIDFGYDLTPGQAGVRISLNMVDETPLLPAKIMPVEDTDKIWGCLQSADPIFTRELPNTKAAIEFYKQNIERCITIHGQQDAYVAPSVACDPHGKASEIVFDIRRKSDSETR